MPNKYQPSLEKLNANLVSTLRELINKIHPEDVPSREQNDRLTILQSLFEMTEEALVKRQSQSGSTPFVFDPVDEEDGVEP